MANSKILRQLIKAGTSGDSDAFRRASETVIEDQRRKQHHLLANDLEQILYADNTAANSSLTRYLPELPRDKEKGLPLLEIKETNRSINEIV